MAVYRGNGIHVFHNSSFRTSTDWLVITRGGFHAHRAEQFFVKRFKFRLIYRPKGVIKIPKKKSEILRVKRKRKKKNLYIKFINHN